MTGSGAVLGRRRVLIIVQNLPVPLDRRVWLECQALRAAGVRVSVICPKGPGDPWREVLDDVRLYKYSPPPAASGAASYAVEFAYCWVVTALLSVVVRLREGFDAIQACNPPDTYWALARLWRLAGTRFVYDQHDLNPELFLSRFGEPATLAGRLQLWLLRRLELLTYRTADHVVSTNESYRALALGRGRVPAEDVTVVRSGPDTRLMRPVAPDASVRRGRKYLAVYLGIMGPQDGVDQAVRAFDILVHDLGREDCHLALLGFGDCLAELRELVTTLGLDDHVTFTGRAGPPEIARYLSTADVGLCPDPKSPLNDVSTMNKTMEYMAYCLPMVTFDLKETRVSAGDAAVYVESGDLAGFAKAWSALLDDRERRASMGAAARIRVVDELDWRPQEAKYLEVWSSVLGTRLARPDVTPDATRPYQQDGPDLDDETALGDFIADRGRG